MANIANQPKIVSGSGRNCDSDAALVNLRNVAQRGSRRNEVRCIDFDVRGAEDDLFGPRGFSANQRDIPDALLCRVSQQSRVGERHQIQADAQTTGDFCGHIGRNALRVAIFSPPGHQQKIAQVDSRTQATGRSQLSNDLGACGGFCMQMIHRLLQS